MPYLGGSTHWLTRSLKISFTSFSAPKTAQTNSQRKTGEKVGIPMVSADACHAPTNQSRSDGTICSRGRKSPEFDKINQSPGGTTHRWGPQLPRFWVAGVEMEKHLRRQSYPRGFQHKKPRPGDPRADAAKVVGLHGRDAENHGMHAVKIGGIEDHVHLLIKMGGELGQSSRRCS